MTFLLASPLHETETGDPSESTATANNTQFQKELRFYIPLLTVHKVSIYINVLQGDDIPREQVAANPIPTTSSAMTFANEHAVFTAAHTACQISVEDCYLKKDIF